MVEVIGDLVIPSELVIPSKATGDLPAAPKTATLFYDSSTGKLKVWTGAAYETITSA